MAQVVETAGVSSDRVHVISWGIDATSGILDNTDRGELKRRLNLPGSRLIVTAIRPIAPLHRTQEIVQAVYEASRRGLEVHLVLLYGYQSNDRRAAAAKAEYELSVVTAAQNLLGDRVTYVAETLRPVDMATLLRATDIAISVPISDQRSSAVLEALGSGAWVIGSGIPAYRELVEDGYTMSLIDVVAPGTLSDAMHGRAPDAADLNHNRDLIHSHEIRDQQWEHMETVLRTVARESK